MSELDIQTDYKEYREVVTGLVSNFHDTIISIIPFIEKAGISSAEIDGSEEFDDVLNSLFRMLVTSVIENKIETDTGMKPEITNYGFYYKNYSTHSYIAVLTKETEPLRYAFNYFKTTTNPFDTAVCNHIDKSGKVIERDIEIKFIESSFGIYFRNN